ncbi:MAG: Crp/Fnr family transcriptional regulator [Bacteroidia bacterium]|jgi:CRP-like cAMP-binding protein|nr:Crp/Fnr family transcriptional regulator [Bacteroidia bacterium]
MESFALPIDCIDCKHLPNSIFCVLKPEELALLNSSKTNKIYKKGSTLFHEGETVKGLHCIEYGKVKLFKTLDDGNMQILRISASGEVIGYRGLLGNGIYIATAEVLEDIQVCFIPKLLVHQFLASNTEFALRLMAKFASDLSEVEEKTVFFVQKSSKERLAEAILMLESSFGVNAENYILLNLTRQELGAFTGLATETIIRTLKTWEDLNILELNKKKIKVVDREELKAISSGKR